MTTDKTLGDQIREQLEASGWSWYRASRNSGVSEPTINRFMHGRGELNLENGYRLMLALGFRITLPQ